MAKASDRAKELIFNALSSTFSTSALIDKKLYIDLEVDGETVQIAVSLTAPKTKVELTTSETGVTKIEAVKVTEDEIQKQKEEVKDIFDFFKI